MSEERDVAEVVEIVDPEPWLATGAEPSDDFLPALGTAAVATPMQKRPVEVLRPEKYRL